MTNRRWTFLLATVACCATACAGSSSAPSGPSGSPTALPSYTAPPSSLPVGHIHLSTAPPPWLPPAVVHNGADSARDVAAAGLPYAPEMLTVHYHAHLDIDVNGKPVLVPAYLGFVVANDKLVGLAPLHTHDNTGLIHIENSVPAKFVLGQLFVEWGVRLTPTCIGGLCADKRHQLEVFVNGQRYDGDPRGLVLAAHQEIAIEFGKSGGLPKPPSTYAFPSGT